MAQDKEAVFSFSDVEDDGNDFDFLPAKVENLQKKKGKSKKIKVKSLGVKPRKQEKLPDYPKTRIHLSKIVSRLGEKDRKERLGARDKISYLVGKIVRNELQEIEKTYGEKFPSVSKDMKRCWNESAEDMEFAVGNFLRKGLPLFTAPDFQEEELRQEIEKTQNQIEKWDNLVAKTKSDVSRKRKALSENQRGPITAEIDPGLQNMLDGLKAKLAAAPKAIQIRSIEARQKLHDIKNKVKTSERTRLKLAKAFAEKAFAEYEDVENPKKLIKSIIQN